MRYDAIVIGGGHNGLTCAAYLARAGRKTLVLERRHVLGGAAVTEEVFPGFTFSVCSYVVSLLRPEIIRDLDLPAHGLELLPLDGTLHADGERRLPVAGERPLRRPGARSPATARIDADAYDDYGMAMVEMGRFAKPILGMTPPDPMSLDPRGLLELLSVGQRFQKMRYHDSVNQVQLLTMSAVDFLDQWFETDVLKATMSASGIIGTFLGRALARHRLRAAAPLHGRDRRRLPLVGPVARRHRHGVERHRRRRPSLRRRDPHRGAGGAHPHARRPRHRRRARQRRRDPRRRRRSAASTRGSPSSASSTPKELPDEFLDGVRRYKYRGSSGKVNLALDAPARLHLPARAGASTCAARSRSRPASTTWSAPTTRRSTARFSSRPYIDIVIPSLTDSSLAPPGKHVMSCFVQYAPYHLKPTARLGRRSARPSATPSSTPSPCTRPNIRNMIRHRQVLTPLDIERDVRPERRQHLPGRAVARTAVLPAPGARLGAVRDAGARSSTCAARPRIPAAASWARPGKNAAERILKDARR